MGQAFRSIVKQLPNVLDVTFNAGDYDTLNIPNNSVIYCDPPYANTTKYSKEGFDSVAFWQWCREKSLESHKVYVSEYNAPDDFVCI
ncbi:MAG: DNA adenine methylase [Paludibacter sp.]|nr:DNA adenine methylase [Paludibacter sp.]